MCFAAFGTALWLYLGGIQKKLLEVLYMGLNGI